MTGGSKIIGMWRDRENDDADENSEIAIDAQDDTLELGIADKVISVENEELEDHSDTEDWSHYSDEESVPSGKTGHIIAGIIAVLALGWTGFFLWANRSIFATLPTAQEGISLTTQWCLPIATLAVIYLLAIRNSTREAHRFNDITAQLRTESRDLEERLKTVNGELSIAREFLASETRELEFFADQSSQKLKTAAQMVKSSMSDGLSSMKKLDEVGDAAYKNLEQLREHLPVVINTAKDVTNQIGNSGRTAQAEIAAMIATLKRVGDVGTSAKKSVDDMTDAAEQSLSKLSGTADEISQSFIADIEKAETGSVEISSLLKKASEEAVTLLNETQETLAKESSTTTQSIQSDLNEMQSSLENVKAFADLEESRLKEMIANLNDGINTIVSDISELDNESGEKTAKLAFAMTALEQNSAALQASVESGHGVADGMIERMEKLLIALDSGARELDETIPAAFARLSENASSGEEALKQITEHAQKAGSVADQLNSKFEQTGKAIVERQSEMETLQNTSEATNQSLEKQISEIASALKDVRDQNEALAESAGEKLISALLRVKDTAKQASEHSREAMENAISGSTETFEKVSEEALSRIIEEKIASIAPKLETAVANAVATTDNTASHLTDQLGAIEDMTTKLEQRILFAKEKAEQSSDENFTRRVALLTESLNSTAIDVSKILSNDVTDTEWAAYLKGDRGIFTRRAVRLLDAGEVREILAQYEGNDEFREHVNRYIHDFEAMLRGVLSTRDGSAISVTLLSSDIGKLYVALAQAIERLRA